MNAVVKGFWVWLIGVLLSTDLWASLALPKEPLKIQCAVESLEELRRLSALGKWTRQIDPGPGSWSFRSPTKIFGQWVEYRINEKGLPSIFLVQDAKSTLTSFARNCTKKTLPENFSPFVYSSNMFSDENLKAALATQRSGIIYVWSPYMIYSVTHFDQFKSLCAKLGIDFVPVVDFQGEPTFLQETISTFNLPANPKVMHSVELFMRGIHHHPVSYVFARGKLSFDPILGVKPDPLLESEIAARLARLFLE